MATRFNPLNLPGAVGPRPAEPPARSVPPLPTRAVARDGDLPPQTDQTEEASLGDDVMAKLAMLRLQIPVRRERILEILADQDKGPAGDLPSDRALGSEPPFLSALMGLDEGEEDLPLPPPRRPRR